MHEHLDRPRQKAVIDEEVLFDLELRITALQIAGAIAAHAVPQDQILSTSWRANRIRLNEPKLANGAGEGRRRKQAASDGVGTQARDRHLC